MRLDSRVGRRTDPAEVAVHQQPHDRRLDRRYRMVAAALLCASLTSMFVVTPTASAFSDVDDVHPFFSEITWLVESGIADGYPDGGYHPGSPITRQAMAAFLHRFEHPDGPPPPPCVTAPFPDVPTTNPFCAEIAWLLTTGIAGGYQDGRFGPGRSITRQAMAAFLRRVAEGVVPPPPCTTQSYADVPTTHGFCGDIGWATANDVAAGYPNGTYRPGEPVTRLAMSAFLQHLDAHLRGLTVRLASKTTTNAYAQAERSTISADGRWVAFSTANANLVPGDTNGLRDVFLWDSVEGTIQRISVSPSGTQATGSSDYPSISADGSLVTFGTDAPEVHGLPSTTNQTVLWHADDGSTEVVSVSSAGTVANDTASFSVLSADGTTVAFTSRASNLVPGDTNGDYDVFVRDLDANTTVRASVATSGAQTGGGWIGDLDLSADGSVVAFASGATNLVVGDTNGTYDVFVRDLDLSTTTRVSVSTAGAQANDDAGYIGLSGDGAWISFQSHASNLVPGHDGGYDFYLHEIATATTTRVAAPFDGSLINTYTDAPSLSHDGRYVAFTSRDDNLVAGDTNRGTDVFRWDRTTNTTVRVSTAGNGAEPDGSSNEPSMSADGRSVAFHSASGGIAPERPIGANDVFLWTTTD